MSFAQFPEQQAIALLQRSMERGRLGHAYLFSGASLGEIEAIARTLAKTLNCLHPPKRTSTGVALDCCDQCLPCRKIGEDIHPDVQWVRPESKSRVIRIEQMRDLMQTIHLKPSEAAWKVAVVAAADRLNEAAANAFLKTLEEPPAKSVFVLLTTHPERVLETISSRCLRLSFTGERVLADSPAGTWIAEFSQAASSGHSLLSRYRLLGVLLNRLTETKANTEKHVSARSPLERYEDVDPKLREKWEDELEAAIEAEYRRERSELLLAVQWWFRDIWLQTLAVGHGLLAFPKLANQSSAVAERISPGDANENLCVLEQLQRLLATNVQEALALEVSMLKLKF